MSLQHHLPDRAATTRLRATQTKKGPTRPLAPPVRDAMLAAVPRLRAFAISLSGSVDRAEDLVQETLLRAITHIHLFRPGTNMIAWLFVILRNQFVTGYRRRLREVEDVDGRYVGSLISPAEQHGRVEFAEFAAALENLSVAQREALLLVGASGFSYEEAAAACKTAVGTVKSRLNRARAHLAGVLAIDVVPTAPRTKARTVRLPLTLGQAA